MNVVCYYNNASGHAIEFGKARSNEKKVKITPKAANEERKENKKLWRKKDENMTMDRDYAFNA